MGNGETVQKFRVGIGRGPKQVGEGVLFRYDDPKASIVFITGDFNAWSPASHPMTRQAWGCWELEVPLFPGIHQYKFIVDGVWVTDPDNPSEITNSFGTKNSVIKIAEDGSISTEVSLDGEGYYHRFEAVESPLWVKDAIIYEVFLRNFSPEGTLDELRERLPELKKLGVTCIWLMPIHQIGEEGRKGPLGSPYAVYDYYSIHPDYGTKKNLRLLVKAVHHNGMKIIIDMVANHTANDSVLVYEHPDWFKQDRKGCILHPHPEWEDVAKLDYDNCDMRDYMVEMMKYWAREFDVDGFRFDVAALVPLDFWTRVRKELKELKADILMLAESHDPAHNALAFDVTYEELLPGVLANIVAGGPARKIAGLLEGQSREFPKHSLRLRYIENHDQPRAMSLLGYPGCLPATVLFMTLDGVPLIYNGQEIGETEKPGLFEAFKIKWDEGNWALREFYRRLCHIRLANPALRRGDFLLIRTSMEDYVFAFARTYKDHLAVVVLNFSDSLLNPRLSLPIDRLGICDEAGYGLFDLWNGGRFSLKGRELTAYEVTIEPYGARVFAVEKDD